MTIGVGTPQRIIDLLDATIPVSTNGGKPPSRKGGKKGGKAETKRGKAKETTSPEDGDDSDDGDDGDDNSGETRPALSVDNLDTIVIDASHIDAKKRGILDSPESVVPLVKLLGRLTTGTGRPLRILFF